MINDNNRNMWQVSSDVLEYINSDLSPVASNASQLCIELSNYLEFLDSCNMVLSSCSSVNQKFSFSLVQPSSLVVNSYALYIGSSMHYEGSFVLFPKLNIK